MYIAHTSKNGNVQLLKDHLENVCKLCETYGEKINLKHAVGLAGLLHDIGKYSFQFQEYLHQILETGVSEYKNGGDHAVVGGAILNEYCINPNKNMLLTPIINAIISHHGKLHDVEDPDKKVSDYKKRINKEIDDFKKIKELFFEEVIEQEVFEKYVEKAEIEIQQFIQTYINYFKSVGKKANGLLNYLNHISVFLTKFIFSCLLDADRLDSKWFDEGKKENQKSIDWHLLQKRLDNKLESFKISNNIDKLRKEMSDQCFAKASGETAIYSLSVPTGGGKTLASLRFALEHLIQRKKKRIIYVVPYTTIIEQNVKEVENILWREGEAKFILEHHSNVINDEDSNWKNQKNRDEYKDEVKNYVDNWDSPIIFTTLVQYLNVFYDAKNRNTRRLHNLMDSIIIFDEVQSVPLRSLALFNESINFLTEFLNTTVLLCTATQPALKKVTKTLKEPIEIVNDLSNVTEQFSRTKIDFLDKIGGYSIEDLKLLVLEKVEIEKNALVIVNTKAVARKLAQDLEKLQENEQYMVFHLSTSMCPEHRREILNQVRSSLQLDGKKVICISTQLIEAGVDISFNCVIRSLAGLSSIAQAAGRCNRHGLFISKTVFVVKVTEENLSNLREIKDGGRFSEEILKDCKKTNKNPLGKEMMELYFEKYFHHYKNEVEFPYNNTTLYKLFFKGFQEPSDYYYSNSIGTASKEFQVIENESETLLVPFKSNNSNRTSGEKLINILLSNEKIEDFTSLLKQAQQYSINIFPFERKLLEQKGAITVITFGNRNILVLNDNSYSNTFGLDIVHSNLSEFIF